MPLSIHSFFPVTCLSEQLQRRPSYLAYLILLCFLGFCTARTPRLALATENVAPGSSSQRDISAWTRQGELGELPQRTSDGLPLSDQNDQDQWTPYSPLTDEFNQAQLDTTRWVPRHLTWQGRQPAWFSPQNVHVTEGQLQLTMKKEAAPKELQARGYHTYSSAAVQAKQKVKYGYFEVRAQPMNSAGSSSFWFAGSGAGWRTEIDVFELGGKAKGHQNRYNMNLHVFNTPESKEHWSEGSHWVAPWPLVENFHVYGLDWSQNEIAYYVDGILVRKVKNTHWQQPLYLIFDSETMPDWLGIPKDEDLPSTFRIDYIRTWKRGTPAEAKTERKPPNSVQ